MNQKPKVYLFNDTSIGHGGSRAVMRSIWRALADVDVIGVHQVHDLSYDPQLLESCDAVVVNGEGTIHHRARAGRFLMEVLTLAQRLGKKTLLVNALFQEEAPFYPDTLRALDFLGVREPRSARQAEQCGGCPVTMLDSCADPNRPAGRVVAQLSGIVRGDVHPFSPSASITAKLDYPHFGLDCQFEDFIATAKQFEVYLTGDQHAIYAAGLAGVPFVALTSNSHEIDSLVEWSGLPIPVCRQVDQLPACIEFARNNPKVFGQFQAFLNSRRVFSELDLRTALGGQTSKASPGRASSSVSPGAAPMLRHQQPAPLPASSATPRQFVVPPCEPSPAEWENLRRVVGGRTVAVLLHGTSIQQLQHRIGEFSTADFCYCSLNLFSVMESRILQQIGKRLSLVYCSSEEELPKRYEDLRGYFERQDDNLLVSTAEAMTAIWPLAEQHRANTLLLDKPGLPLALMPNSLTVLLLALVKSRATSRILLFGADGLLRKGDHVADSYYGGEILRRETRCWNLIQDTELFNLHFASLLERLYRSSGVPPVEILNCNPESFLTPFRKISYDEALALPAPKPPSPVNERDAGHRAAGSAMLRACRHARPLIRGEHRGFNLIEFGDEVLALSKDHSLDELVSWDETDLCHQEEMGNCVRGCSVEEVLTLVDVLLRPPPPVAPKGRGPILVKQGVCGYNLVEFNSEFIALAQSLGPVDLNTLPPERLAEWGKSKQAFVARSLDELEKAVQVGTSHVSGEMPAALGGGQVWCSFLIPTRNNLPGLKKLFDSIVATTEDLGGLEVVLAMDEDDAASQAVSDHRLRLRKVVVPKGMTMGALNNACFEASSGRFLMLMNDDVVLRTPGWDRQVLAVYRRYPDDIALIHVNDLLFREKLCTFPMLSRRACIEIGLCPTAYRRYRIDDHIYDTYNLLAHLGYPRIIYLPEVVFEHENHVSEAAPGHGHQFASVDKKVYVPKSGIIEADAKYCDEHFEDRKAAALKLAALIEADAHRRSFETLRRKGSERLAAVTDSHSYRRPAYLQVQQTSSVRNSDNTRCTVAVVTADLRGEVPQRCLKALKAHTRNYDLVILDNNRGPNFSHPRQMNKVLETCSTEFLVLLDDDVIVEEGWLDGLLRCADDSTGVVVPLHKDGRGALSFSGIYFTGDGSGAHAHTLDRPEQPRVVQAYCSAAMLIDLRKCGHIRMDEAYHKYFFDLVHGFEVWEAGYKAVCSPYVTVTHLGGATVKWGSAEANAFQERDRTTFVRSWISSGRVDRLRQGIWKQHPYLLQIEELPRSIEGFLSAASGLSGAEFQKQLQAKAAESAPFSLLQQRLLAGLVELLPTFASQGEPGKIADSIRAASVGDNPAAEIPWLLTAADRLLQQSCFRTAEKLLVAGLERHPQVLDLWRALGITRMRCSDLVGARDAFSRALRLAPTDVESRGGLAAVLFQLQAPEESARQFEQVLRYCQAANPKDPRLEPLARNLATVRKHLGTVATPPRSRAPEPQPVSGMADAPANRLRILLIPFECIDWRNARAWSYNGYMAFEEGLAANGVDFVTLPALAGLPSDHPASWVRYAESVAKQQRFDQVWVWLTHNEYSPAFLKALETIAPVRVGVVMESMEHTAEEYALYTKLPGRRERVISQLRHFTHVLTFDDFDAGNFERDLPIKALWTPPVVPWRTVCTEVKLPAPGPGAFYGTLYSPERQAFLNTPLLRGKLVNPKLPEEGTELPRQFDQLHAVFLSRLAETPRVDESLLETYLGALRQLRRQFYGLWLEGIQNQYAAVNLPSIFKSYAGRVVESMAAGRPVVSWAPPRQRTRALFTPGEEILLFDRSSATQLASHLDSLRRDRAWATSIAQKARLKVLNHHTAEIRVRQILDWIEFGTQPEYGEAKPVGHDAPVVAVKTAGGIVNGVPASLALQKPAAISLPACARIGHLGEARSLLNRKQFRQAWELTVSALEKRPFHPEAYLLLAEIALAAGDSVTARRCAQEAHGMAPGWKPAKRFLKGNLRGNQKHDWMALPGSLQGPTSKVQRQPTKDRSSEPRLSVCLIVKNEEEFLDRCLKSVHGLASQIVVVDTGSTDRTVEIAKTHAAEVHHFTWCDDFSAARNAALEHATGDWILMLDADEELPPENHASLRKLLREDKVMAWRLPIIDIGREDEGCGYVPRLFRNAPALFYIARVHEQVFSSIEARREEWGLDNRLGDAALLHHGYRPEVIKDRNKIERNLRLLEKAIEELPGEANLLMNYGLELIRSGQREFGLEQYWKAFDAMSNQAPGAVVPETREMFLTQFCTQLMAANQHAEIVRLLTSPLAKTGGLTASLHFTLGLAHLELKQFREAADQMRQALNKRGQRSLAPIHKDIHGAAPRHCLALCLDQLGEADAAAEQFRLAIQEGPQSRPARCDYARFLAAHEQAVEALNLLFALAKEKPDDLQVWRLGGQLALGRPEFLEVACDWTAEALNHVPEDPVLYRQRAEALTLSGQCGAALPLWRRLQSNQTCVSAAEDESISGRPDSGLLAALVISEIVAGENRYMPPAQLEPMVSREFVNWYQRLLQFRARPVVEGLNERIEALSAVLPTAGRLLTAAMAEAGEPAMA